MSRVDNMPVSFRGRNQRTKYGVLSEREMLPTIYPHHGAMTALGIRDSVLFLLNQIGWDSSRLMTCYATYRNLTLEFLSSLIYFPTHGFALRRGLIIFRLFGITFKFNHKELGELLGFPNGIGVYHETQEEYLGFRELDYFWGSISGILNPEPEDFVSENIHNPAFRYFHKILAHTIFGKPQNVTTVSKDELFIMFCASQNRPVNAITYLIRTFVDLIDTDHAPIRMGGLVTMIANVVGPRQSFKHLNAFTGITCMTIEFCFNTGIIGDLGPTQFTLLINGQVMQLFTLPNPATSVHNKANWLFGLDQQPSPPRTPETPQDYEVLEDSEEDPTAPSGYYDMGPPQHDSTAHSVAPDTVMHEAPTIDYAPVIHALQVEHQALRDDLTSLRADFFGFMDTVSAQFQEVFAYFHSSSAPKAGPCSG